jgi:hypothetical protein
MPQENYERYLARRPVYEAFGGVNNRQSPTMTILSRRQVPEANYYIEPGWIYGIPEPNPSLHEHRHDYDEIVLHWGSDPRTPQELGGEIEFYVGGQPITFNTTTAFYIPRGTSHGPVTWKKFRHPHMQMAIMLGTGEAAEAWGESGVSEAKAKLPVKQDDFDYEQYAVRSPIREAGAEFTAGLTSPTLTYMSNLQVPGVNHYIEMGWTFGMPVSRKTAAAMPEMVHKDCDEIVLHIGGDPDDPEDLGADIEFGVGGQPLRFNTTSALFIPRGLRHGPLRCIEYRKPHMVITIMCGAGTLTEGWGDSFIA